MVLRRQRRLDRIGQGWLLPRCGILNEAGLGASTGGTGHQQRTRNPLSTGTAGPADPRRYQGPPSPTMVDPWARQRHIKGHAGAGSGSSTPPSMTAPGSPTQRSSTTNKLALPPGSLGRPPGTTRSSPAKSAYRSGLWHRRHRHPGQKDQAIPTPNQRQSLAPRRGMGLHPPLDLRHR